MPSTDLHRPARRRRLLPPLLVLPVLPALVPAPAAAAAPERVLLDRPGASVQWRDALSDAVVADPQVCPPGACDETLVTVAPAGEWDRLVVAVDYRETVNGFDVAYDLSLHVYDPDGTRVGTSASPFTGQVVTVDGVRPGTYRMVVAADLVVGELPYRASAALSRAPRHPASRELLPNLVAMPPTSLQIASAPYSAAPPFILDARNLAKGPRSCYPQETAERGAHRCLRFDQTVANLGTGPLDLRAAELAEGATMRQRIARGDGSFRERDAGSMSLHLQHGHFHYEDYAQALLYASDPTGTRGPLLRVGFKTGFCMADVENVRFGQLDQEAPRYVGPGMCDGQEEVTTSRVGISAGWADTYPWYTGDQYIELSGVPDGLYLLELQVNRTAALLEATTDDNSAATLFRLTGDTVEVLGYLPAAGHAR